MTTEKTDSASVSAEVKATLGSRLKAAGQLTAKHAQRTKLTNVTLPNAYRALGKHVHANGVHRTELAEAYQQLDDVLAQVQSIKDQAAARPKAEGFAAKAGAAAISVKEAAQVKALELKVRHALTRLGEAAFEKHGDESGPEELAEPIAKANAQLEALAADIATLSQMNSSQFLTPKRIALGGVVLAALLLVVVLWAMSGGGGASYGPGSETRIVGTWKQHWEGGVSHVVRFTKEGTLVVTQVGRTDGHRAEDVGKYSLSNGELTAYGEFSRSGTASIEFTSADEMIVGNLDKDVHLGACNLDGTWKRVKEGSPEALVDEFFDQIKGAWLNVKENGQKLTISKDAVVLEDTGGTFTKPYTMDVSKKAITFLSKKNSTYFAKLG